MYVISIYTNHSASGLHFSFTDWLKTKGTHYGFGNTGSRSSCIYEDGAYMKRSISSRVLGCVKKSNLPD